MYTPPNSIMMLLKSSVALMGGMRNAYRVMTVNPNWNSLVGKPRRRRDDNLKFKKIIFFKCV
jgi:hypothetical protein